MKNLLKRTFIIFICLIFFSVPFGIQSAFPQSEAPIQAGENTRSIMSGNQTRQYLLYIPAGYDGKIPLPLVLLFHGTGGTPKGVMELTDLHKVAEKKKFIIAAPAAAYSDFRGKTWNANPDPKGVNDVEFVKDLLREISSKVAIDKKRIYAAGYSHGARMSSLLACDLSNDIAAIGGVAGVIFPATCAPSRPVPVINIYGTEDTYYLEGDHSAQNWAEKNGCQKAPKTKTVSKVVEQMTYASCKTNAELVIYRIKGGGHIWPDSPIAERLENAGTWPKGKTNKDINATNLIWGFFEAHSMP